MSANHCQQCNRSFAGWEALKQHWDNSAHVGYECYSCNRWFGGWQAIQQHWKDSSYHDCKFCAKCDEYFPDLPAQASHHITKHSLVCGRNGCTEKFATERLLSNHTQEKHCQCPFGSCGLEFTKSQLEDHLYHKHMFCRKCNTYFKTEARFKDHKANSTAHSWCPSCCIEVESSTLLAQHCRNIHRRCETCKLNFFSEETYNTHLSSSNNHHFCNKCMKEFTSPNHLVKHYSDPSNWSPGAKHHYCSQCSCDFDDLKGLKNHYFSSDVHYYCYICNDHFSTEAGLTAHINRAASSHPYCSGCKVAFKTTADLRRHIVQNPLTHHYCSQCDLNFTRSSELDRHKVESDSHHYCEPCNVEYHNDESLLVHREAKHHFCRRCSIVFSTLQDLVHHKTHDTKHSFCSRCKLDFPNGGALRNHVLALHYHCERCEETFWTEDSLKVHRRASAAHNECNECDFDFYDEETLNIHLEARHGYCFLCQEMFGSPQSLENHRCGFHKDTYCSECKAMHENAKLLLQHKQTTRHYYRESDTSFGIQDGLELYRKEKTDHHDDSQYRLDLADSDTSHVHRQVTHHQCEFCEQSFEAAEELNKHISWCYDYCRTCGQVFADYEVLLARKSSNDQNHYGCPDCQMQYHNYVRATQSPSQSRSSQSPINTEGEEGEDPLEMISKPVFNATTRDIYDAPEMAQAPVGTEKAATEHDDTAPTEETIDSAGESIVWHSEYEAPQDAMKTEEANIERDTPEIEATSSGEQGSEEERSAEEDPAEGSGEGGSGEEGSGEEGSGEEGSGEEGSGEEKPVTGTKCIVCSRYFSSKSEMIKHCENEECYILESQFHELLANNDPWRVFTLVSIYTPRIRRPRARGMAALQNKVTGLYKCLHCPQEFVESSELGDHLESDAHRERPFMCPRPGCIAAHFITFGALLDHLNETECAAWIKAQDDNRFDYIKSYLD